MAGSDIEGTEHSFLNLILLLGLRVTVPHLELFFGGFVEIVLETFGKCEVLSEYFFVLMMLMIFICVNVYVSLSVLLIFLLLD